MGSLRYIGFSILFCLIHLSGLAQSQQDSAVTPFQKGRWILGLTGTISSGSVRSDSASSDSYSLEYSLNLSGAKLVSDRWAIGGFFQGERSTPARFFTRETEAMVIGPQVTWYLSRSFYGSVFINVGVGYSRFRDQSDALVNGQVRSELVSGQGVAVLGTIGYAVVVTKNITFDLGLNTATSWIWAERTINSQPGIDDDFRLTEVAFSFGFKVLL